MRIDAIGVSDSEIDALSKQVTGRSWPDLEQSLKGGYVPTLRPHAGKSAQIVRFNELMEQLAAAIEGRGYKVWRGVAGS